MEIRLVEIEIHSYCNRKCKWCPNYSIDRTKQVNMDESIYLKILNELKEINYSGCISYSRYNEPLSDIELLEKRISQARKILPNVKIVTNTNGDYLDDLDRLLILDELTIMDYDNRGNEYIINKLLELGASITDISNKGILAKYKNLKILYHNFWNDVVVSNRGGILDLEKIERLNPCYEPSYFIGVDYNGNIVPCCNIRSDYHSKNLILGNLTNNTLYDIINSNKAKKFREKTSSCNFEEVCRYCNKNGGRYTDDTNNDLIYNK